MPSQLTTLGNNFPTFDGEETPEEQILSIQDYLFQLREGLQYSLRNLSVENFNAADLKQLTAVQQEGLIKQLQKMQTALDGLEQGLKSLAGTVQVPEDGPVTIGTEGRELRLIGNVYINGALFTGGTA